MQEISIGNFKIGGNFKPLVIAEMSGNHNQSLERALAIVDAAASAGVQAVKLQTYTADTMTLDVKGPEFLIENQESLWYGSTLYELYQKAHTPWEWHKPIFERCRQRGVMPLSTPFDATAVDFLESLGTPCYKIASFEMTDLPLIKKVAATKKPMIISTGMATAGEIDETVRTAKENGCCDIVLLKCTSTYPALPRNSNLATLPHMKELFGCQVGISDHTLGFGVAVAGVALGATVIEKHFTLSRLDGGVDAAFSMEPEEMKLLCQEAEKAWLALGKIHYGAYESEKSSLEFRRSLYITKDLKADDILSAENIGCIRPGFGLAPRYYEIVLGKRVRKDVKKGTAVSWDIF